MWKKGNQIQVLRLCSIFFQLISLDQWIAGQTNLRFWDFYRTEIDNYFENPNDFVPPVSKRLPDGSPIGSFSCDD